MVFAQLEDGVASNAAGIAARIKEFGVRVGAVGPRRFRMVTHYWIDDQGIERAVRAFRKSL
jgi:threonine aldolase